MKSAFARLFAIALAVVSPAAATANPQLSFAGFTGVQMNRGPQNHLVVQVQVNGRPAALLVDTGSDISFLRADRAQQFGVNRTGAEIQRRGRSFPLVAVPDVVIGGVSLGRVEAALTDAAQFRGTTRTPGGSADGVIGVDLLRRRNALINCRTRQLFLKTDPGALFDLAATTRGLGFTQIPLDRTRRGGLTVPCNVRGRAGKLLVDTGAFVTGFDDDMLRALGVPTRPSGLTTRGFDGEIRPIELVQISNLRIGGVAIAPQTFGVMDLYGKKKPVRTFTGLGRIEYYAPRAPAEQIVGVLGNELLDQRHAIIDVGGMSLFLK